MINDDIANIAEKDELTAKELSEEGDEKPELILKKRARRNRQKTTEKVTKQFKKKYAKLEE